ncbi:MAG: chorismate mutase [Lachnospiraceae bacterium]|nr:chorismate mutase [Lachnospiraceae bacterium]
MQDLSITRQQIDEVDSEIVKLIEKRMDLALEVAKYKSETGKPIYDKAREEEKLDKLGNLAHGKFNARSVQELFTQIMSVSRRYQYRAIGDRDHFVDKLYKQIDKLEITSDTKAVYAGVPGAFAETALVSFFGENVMSTNVADFTEVAKAVSEGRADYGVLPIENSTAGFVNGIYDLFESYNLSIVGEQMVKVDQCLLGLAGTEISGVRTVFSHPQGLMQAKEYLEDKDWRQVSMGNTALAAKKVKEDGDTSQVAIASERAAKIYGLNILNPKLNVSSDNTTRFVIVSNNREYEKDSNRVSVSFSLPHAVGSLYNILAHFIFNDVNMTSIESVPLSDKQWEYCFFVDFEGSLSDNDVKNALMAIKEETENFRIIGCFQSEK